MTPGTAATGKASTSSRWGSRPGCSSGCGTWAGRTGPPPATSTSATATSPPPCFRLRRGGRHLEPDAVPTLFQDPQKRKAVDDFQEKPKRLRTGGSPGVALDAAAAVAMAPGVLPVLPLYQLQADAPPGPAEAGGGQPVSPETAGVVTWEGPVQETQVIAYFETIPNVLPCEGAGPAAVAPETVLSAALSPQPISSTLPIVSKHTPPPPQPTALALGDEGDEEDEGEEGEEGDEGEEGLSEAEDPEEAEHQLDEHCYHRSRRSREQLEALVAALQRKLQLLQQRLHTHTHRTLLLEGTLGKLTQSSLLTQERLQLLERAFVQAGVAAAGVAGETVAIIYEQDSAAFLYTPLPGAQTAL
ncbi:uncharacterized protein ACNS7B_015886 [Menidia menidia]